jgi:hypothetical protein
MNRHIAIPASAEWEMLDEDRVYVWSLTDGVVDAARGNGEVVGHATRLGDSITLTINAPLTQAQRKHLSWMMLDELFDTPDD